KDEAIDLLAAPQPETTFSGHYQKGNRPLVFVFPGQGAQYPGMGRGLYGTETVYRQEVDRCLDVLDRPTASSLRSLLLSADTHNESAVASLQDTALTQPALFVVSYALARQLMQWGIRPDAMIGHSIGEYVAACLSGVIEVEDAIKLVLLRGKLISKLTQ